MKILGIERSTFATNHYRILQPLYKLHEHGLADVSTCRVEDIAVNLDKSMSKIMEADIIVTYSPSNEDWLNLIKTLRRNGKIIVADYDDDPLNVSPWNPSYRFTGTKEVAYQWQDGTVDMLWSEDMVGGKGETGFFNIERNIKQRDLFSVNFKKADLVTTTTDVLAESLNKINPNIAVLPNLVDFGMYPECELVKKKLRIGWQGGSSHYEDLWLIVEPMKTILKRHPDITFVYFGDMRMAGLFKDFPQNQVEYHSWVDHKVYPYKLALLNLDIGLCPVADNIFNRSKTAIKYFEYSVYKMVTIASNITPYSNVITNDKDGLLVNNNANEWIDAIERVVYLNNQIGQKAYDNVYENHNADKDAYKWVEAYNKVLNKQLVEV